MQARLPPQFNMLALVRRIQPRDSELTSAKTHQLVVRTRLLSSFDISRYISIGSHARKTAIRTHSDLDALVVVRRNEAKWGGSIVSSETLLRRVILDLKGRFPQSDIPLFRWPRKPRRCSCALGKILRGATCLRHCGRRRWVV